MKDRNLRIIILNIVIVILAFFFLLILWLTVEEVSDTLISHEYDESFLLYVMEDEDYGRLVDIYYQNCGSDGEENRNLQEYYGVAKYYEASFFYQIYAEAEDTVRMDKYRTQMEEAVAQMGEFSFMAEKIDNIFQ